MAKKNNGSKPVPPAKSLRPKKAAFLRTLAKIGNISTAAELCNMARSNHYDWMRDDPEYPALYHAAMETATDKLEEEAQRRAVEGVQEPIYQNGELVGHKLKYSDVLLMFLLNGARPEKYKRVTENRSLNLHQHNHHLDLSGLTDDQIKGLQKTLTEIAATTGANADPSGSGNGAPRSA